jgi:peptidoglycan/LPS O-acetylase OafA/YrhL
MWRLYPAYFVSVVGTFALLWIASSVTPLVGYAPSFMDLLSHLTLAHGYSDNYFYGIVHVYWSLALEFQLYLAFPLFLYLFRRIGITQSVLALTVVSIVWRYYALSRGYGLISVSTTGPYTLMGCLLARMPEWLFGVWLAEWYVGDRKRTYRRGSLLAGSGVLLGVAIASSLSETYWGLTDILFGLGFVTMVAGAITQPTSEAIPARSKPYRSLVWIGTISYSLYLFHMQISWLLRSEIESLHGELIPFLLRIAVLIASIPVIALLYRHVEAPFLRFPKPGERYYSLYLRLRKRLGIKTDKAVSVPLGSSVS